MNFYIDNSGDFGGSSMQIGTVRLTGNAQTVVTRTRLGDRFHGDVTVRSLDLMVPANFKSLKAFPPSRPTLDPSSPLLL